MLYICCRPGCLLPPGDVVNYFAGSSDVRDVSCCSMLYISMFVLGGGGEGGEGFQACSG